MESTFRIERVNTRRELLLAIDVSKSTLEFRSDVPESEDSEGRRVVRSLQGSVARRSGPIVKLLMDMQQVAREYGYEHVRVLCEPTGGFEQPVLRMARRMGCLTSYVSGESVNKAKVIDHNDTGKTDVLDTGVILTVAGLGKVLTHRVLPPLYRQLRNLNRQCNGEDAALVAAKCGLHYAVSQTFCDFSRKSAFFYTDTGRAVMDVYQYNPYRIVEAGRKRFASAIRRKAPRVRERVLQELWDDAVSSSRHEMLPEECAIWEQQVRHRWEEYLLHEERQRELRAHMVAIYEQLVAQGEPIPMPHKRFLSAFSIARILAETGPLADFPNPAAILKHAGLNLRRRQSGKFEGQIRTSHKGSVDLRHAVGDATYGLVRRQACYGHYYHRKKDEQKMKAAMAMTAVMRKVLVAVWTLGVKRVAFDEQRLFMSESGCRKAA